ncbi:MAG TPA: NAD-dependent deacylase [Polyangiaceae bacterium]|nr:NAD-dependent deacylase [Polyangiaceae bacterium]
MGSTLTLLPDAALERLRSARRVVALTGAGISAESGVPTFRDAQTGLWAKYRAEELATPEAFLANPRLVWDWYAWRRQLTGQAKPNPGHSVLARFQELFSDFTLITQNVDGLHERAGSRNILELHGNIDTTLCFDEGTPVSEYEDDGVAPPRCPRCGGLLRPGVVWFGESLPRGVLERARLAAEACEVLLSVGTSSLVHPAAGLPLLAQERGALLLEVNPSSTPLTPYVDFALSGPAGQILPQLLQQIEAERH